MDIGTTITIIVETIGGVVALAGITVVIVLYVRARIKSASDDQDSRITEQANKTREQTLEDLKTTVTAVKTQNGIQANQITTLTKSNKELSGKVSELTGKVDTLSTIPLDKIEKHMADTNKILQAILPLIPTETVKHTISEITETNKQGA